MRWPADLSILLEARSPLTLDNFIAVTTFEHKNQNEVLIPGGLYALLQYVSPELTSEVSVELGALAKEWPVAYTVEGKEDTPVSHTRMVSDVYGDFSPALKGVLGLLGVSMRDSMVFNYQEPMATQRFHTDGSDVVVFHYEGRGSFDYAPDAICLHEAQRDYATKDTRPGDVIISLMPKLWHRGRSRSLDSRTNVAFFKSMKEKWELLHLKPEKDSHNNNIDISDT